MRRGVLIGCCCALACLPAASSEAATIKTTFDSSAEGWTVVGDPQAPAAFQATGGNPGGFVRVVDGATGASMYWVAPPRFHGNRSANYGGELSFDLRQSSTASQYDDDDVVIVGGGLTLAFDTATNPGTDWTHYAVPLAEKGWVDKGSGNAATQAQMTKALSSVTAIRIRAEFVTGSFKDVDDLDNVVFGDAQPIAGKTVIVGVESGKVFISTPAGTAAYGPIGRVGIAAAKKFRRFKGSASIPVGSTLDTRAGRIEMTSAADLKGKTQRAQFNAGIFTVRQRRTARPSTELTLESSSFGNSCGSVAAGGRVARAGKRLLGRLFGRGKGRYQTKANFSAASVRGTTWLTEDRCDGTLTKVTSGQVAVHDLAKSKTVTVTAGHSYLARATRAAIKRLKVR